jgi:hypothetical protein
MSVPESRCIGLRVVTKISSCEMNPKPLHPRQVLAGGESTVSKSKQKSASVSGKAEFVSRSWSRNLSIVDQR